MTKSLLKIIQRKIYNRKQLTIPKTTNRILKPMLWVYLISQHGVAHLLRGRNWCNNYIFC